MELRGQMSGEMWLKNTEKFSVFQLVWQGVLLPLAGPTCIYMANPGLYYLAQNVDVAISVQFKPLREEVGWYDITFTADNTEDHACRWKLSALLWARLWVRQS